MWNNLDLVLTLHYNTFIEKSLEELEEPLYKYRYVPDLVLKNGNITLYWDRSIITDRTIVADKPDIKAVDRIKRIARIIDITVPHDGNLVKAEKDNKLSSLARREVVDMWNVKSAIILLIVVSANGLIAKSLDQHLRRLSLDGWIKGFFWVGHHQMTGSWFMVLFPDTGVVLIKSQFFDCHDDPGFDPEEGPLDELQFTWLGALQYIHVKNGTPHYFRVPRVILISRQFALSTATDAAQIPEGYALGNVVFGDYERDHEECHITIEDIASGMECDPAVLLMPIADVLLHPEYKHFGAKYSVALLKLITSIKSNFMLPACLPLKNYIVDKEGKITRSPMFHVDFSTDVPRDFITEDKEVSRVSILPRELCYLYDIDEAENATKMTRNRMTCTTGCGFHSGAPTLVHEHTGHWSIVALSQGGPPCPDPLRTRRPPPPPHHILIHPYVPWITAAITGKAVGAFAKDDPFGFIMPRASIYDTIAHGWVGHWWMGGLRCFDRGEAADDIFKFYHEIFQLKPITETFLTYYLEIDAAHNTMIICVKVGMPYQLGKPRVWELDTPIVKVRIPLIRFISLYKFQVEAWGYNSTESSATSSTDSKDSSG